MGATINMKMDLGLCANICMMNSQISSVCKKMWIRGEDMHLKNFRRHLPITILSTSIQDLPSMELAYIPSFPSYEKNESTIAQRPMVVWLGICKWETIHYW